MKILRSSIVAAIILLSTLNAYATELVPKFNYVSSDFFNPMKVQLDVAWAEFGLQERGMNYYSSGAPLDGSPIWQRFNPNGDTYQTWFGAYVISNFQYASEWTGHRHPRVKDISNSVNRVIELAIIDQIVWQRAYGDPNPAVTLVPGSVQVVPFLDGYFAVHCKLLAHSDTGDKVQIPYPWYPDWTTYSSVIDPYAPITIDCFVLFKYLPEADRLVVIYSSGTEWSTADGVQHKTPSNIRIQQLLMTLNVRFVPESDDP